MFRHVVPWALLLASAPCVRAVAAPPPASERAWGDGAPRAIPVGPTGVGGVVAVAIDPAAPERLALATRGGAVWTSIDGGRRWARILAPLAGERAEEALAELEVAVGDRVGEVEAPDPPDPEDFGDPEALEDAWEDWEAEVEALRREADERAREALEEVEREGAAGPSGAALAYGADGLVVARADGIWTSVDHGRSWSHRAEPLGVTALAEGPGGMYVGADDGLWLLAAPGAAPRRVSRGPGVRAIAVDGALVWTAGDDGLVLWEGDASRRVVEGPMDGVAAGGGEVWAHGPGGLYRVRDGEVTASAPPPGGLAALALAPGVGLVGAGPKGLWIAADPGRGWSRVVGPRAPARVASAGGVVIVGGPAGAHRIAETGPRAPGDLPLSVLIDAVGADRLGPPSGLTARRGTWSVPDLTVDAVMIAGSRDRTVSEQGAALRVAESWRVGVRLDWWPRPARSPVRVQADGLGRVVLLEDPAARAGAARRAWARRSDRVEQVVALYEQRAAWLERARRSTGLLEATLARIGVEECEALLDGITGGAVTRWMAAAP